MPNIPRQDPTVRLKLYVGDISSQAKPSTTGAKYKIGFTLFEVLITLSIIGVVAALTIPSLIAKNQEKEAATKLKKTYNVLSEAYSLAQVEYGNVENWGEGPIAIVAFEKMQQYLKFIKVCPKDVEGCFNPRVSYAHKNGTSRGILDKDPSIRAILSDGTFISFDSFYSHIDINGKKGPNKVGQDTFLFLYEKNRIIPAGYDSFQGYSLEESCNEDGWGCTAWLIQKENMDYLKKKVSWD